MKNSFLGYYRPSDDEFAQLWQTATFALDANVLLNMYGYSARTRSSLLALFRSIEERLWVPYQFAREYQRNRFKAIAEQVNSYAQARKDLRALLDQKLRIKHKQPFVGKKSILDLERICEELAKGQREYERLYSSDPHFAEVSKLLEKRIGLAPDAQAHDAHCAEARNRYSSKTPPGYSDSAKPEPDAFGDFFGWKEILTHGQASGCATILVTDDQKEDWWYIHNKDRRIGPRPELIEEYWRHCQKPFYMYSLEEFMRYAQKHLGQKVTSAVLQEVRERSASQAEEPPIKHQRFTGAADKSDGLTAIELGYAGKIKSGDQNSRHSDKPDSQADEKPSEPKI